MLVLLLLLLLLLLWPHLCYSNSNAARNEAR
jgi:hypothetical protein